MELTRTHKIIIAVAAVLLLAGLTFFLLRRRKKQETAENYFGDEAMMLAAEVDAMKENLFSLNKKIEEQKKQEKPDDNFPLRMGSVGKRVEQLQMFLLKHWGWQGKIDGKFGEQTQRAVEKYLQLSEITENIYNAYNLGIIKTSIFK